MEVEGTSAVILLVLTLLKGIATGATSEAFESLSFSMDFEP